MHRCPPICCCWIRQRGCAAAYRGDICAGLESGLSKRNSG
ncbi:hypothetical protein BSLA_01f0739 [Burkholderia stabilis]|nr:hypothetical protein BSLA_01f0739 [Burkholderia stabilis]